MLTPGERIGFVALAPGFPDRERVLVGLTMAQVLSGWAFPNSILQHAIDRLDQQLIDLELLQQKRDRMVDGLRQAGFDATNPEGTFYVIVKTPGPDDIAFCDRLAEQNVFVLPGSIFDMPGYFRISLTATMDMIDRALPVFESTLAETAVPV